MRLSVTAIRARHRRFLLGLTVGLVASLGAAIAMSRGYLFDNQAKTLEVFFWLRGQTRAPEIVLVAIDDAAFQRLNERQPLPRKYLAAVVRGIRKSGARLIVMDIDLRQPTAPADDRALVAELWGPTGDPTGPVVVARTLRAKRMQDGETRYRLIPLYDASLEAASGFAEVPRDDDGFFRRIPLAVPLEDGGVAGSLALVALSRLGGHAPEALARHLAGPEPIQLPLPAWDEARGEPREPSPLRFYREDDWKINFVGPTGSFLTISSEAVYSLDVSDQPAAQDNPFRDRIVLIGANFAESRDAFPTPRGLMYGLEIHANILHTLLSRSQIQPIAWGPSLLLQFVLCVAVAWLFAATAANKALAISVAVAALILFGVNFLGLARGAFWYDFLTPILAIRVGSQWHDIMERRRIRQSFHEHVGREVADRIYRDDPSLSGECRNATVMYVALHGSTAAAEALPPDDLAQHLNAYFSRIAKIVEQHRGLIVDFSGDGAVVVYGAPADHDAHALDALRAADRLHADFVPSSMRWSAQGSPPLRIGLGIHTGIVFAGNVGSAQRKQYTVVGDVVNVASLVAKVNEELQTTLLITAETYAAAQDRVTVVDRGEIMLKGRQQPVKVYEVLSVTDVDPAV